ncbi:preprotein translocase subunit SecD [Streptomyces sp. CB03234]|uniref:protein translocase subunit SecD n=1 Tax=Streptomyces sp. (strain CB03234) TaxID=1703937 RepID=UPI00093BB744|nr:protein translocase subunit SecD [Streptomyces sp. CB03234]OKJ96839.1 preprotein translocase subunit SecD [Streptomyces sp. CB03234]
MAAPKKGRGPATGGQGKPGRALAVILIAIGALIGGMFWSGDTTPRLGIDLAGGTSITLRAENQPGKPDSINNTNMQTAIGIIERRVNGLGVSESEVQQQGNRHIIVNIPRATDSEAAENQVGTTAELYFRPVLAVAGSAPLPEPSASGSPSATPSGKASTPPSPKASATTQGRAVTDSLKKAPTPKPTATDKPATTPAPQPSASGAAAVAALEKQFTALDCTPDKKTKQVPNPARNSDPAKPTVACGSEGDAKYILGPAEVAGTDVDEAQGVFDPQRGRWIVQLGFTDAGTKKFAATTGKLASQVQPQNQFAISLDGQVVSAPSVSSAIGGGSAEISGSFDQQSATELANVLSYGALPLSFEKESVTTVTAALGGEQLKAGLIAGAIGLALVVIYLVVYYRGLSIIALLSLLVSAALTYALMSLLGPAIGFALNLPAVCGAIVAIGITADSFIVYFERVRDEIRDGRTLRPAVERGWPRARRTILVSDFVSFLAAAVLFIVTVGKVQGFAFTLGLTTLLDVVVVFFFTKPLMTLMARTKFFSSGHPWSGLDPRRLGAKPPLRRSRRVSAITEPKEA